MFPKPSLTKDLPHFEISPSLIHEVFLVVVVICIPLVRREVKQVSDIFRAFCFLFFELPFSGPLPMCLGGGFAKITLQVLQAESNLILWMSCKCFSPGSLFVFFFYLWRACYAETLGFDRVKLFLSVRVSGFCIRFRASIIPEY